MNSTNLPFRIPLAVLFTLLLAAAVACGEDGAEEPLKLQTYDAGKVTVNGNASIVKRGDSLVISIAAEQKMRWPGVNLKPQKGSWFDLSHGSILAMDLQNLGKNQIGVKCQIENRGSNGRQFCVRGGRAFNPGESGTLRILYYRDGIAPDDLVFDGIANPFEGMKGRYNLNVHQVTNIMLFTCPLGKEVEFSVSNIRVEPPVTPVSPALKSAADFFPAIDRYGQYKHKQWPGKTRSDNDLLRERDAEAVDLAAHPRPTDWNRYGGWANGPSLRATGHFRTEKYHGKWYLVDPEGKLFFSHGIDQFEREQVTGITLREHYFEELPPLGSPEAEGLYRKQGYAPGGDNFYKNRKTVPDSYDFFGANLRRKYGPEWKKRYRDRLFTRAASWGINTMGNWSIHDYVREGVFPYVAQAATPDGPVIPGHPGSAGRRFQDVFSPLFEQKLVEYLNKHWAFAADDPMCIGFFVDNEHAWGGETSLAEATLRSSRGTATKQEFCRRLKEQYGSIKHLNAAWGSSYPSFDALLDSREPPPAGEHIRKDLVNFNTVIARRYFEGCRNAIRRFAPDKLYLGCRFAGIPQPELMRNAAEYCDVVSFNLYEYSIEDFRLPSGCDKPVIIGEFHFGTLANGNSHPGLQGSASDDERGRDYQRYLEGALRNPCVVGTHYYRLIDQSPAGRTLDNENFSFGFLNICDRPYPEMVRAARDIAARMYQIRHSAEPDTGNGKGTATFISQTSRPGKQTRAAASELPPGCRLP